MLKIIEWNEQNASILPLHAAHMLNDIRCPEHPFYENVSLHPLDC